LQATSLHTIAIGPQHYAIKIKNLEKVASREKKMNRVLLGRRAQKNWLESGVTIFCWQLLNPMHLFT
jgi:hypothetical protein